MNRLKTLTIPFKKNPPPLEALFGRKTLLLGETNSGKTHFTFNFLCSLFEDKTIHPSDISVLDFAPPYTNTRNSRIGGTFREFIQESNTLPPSLVKQLNSVHWGDQEFSDPPISSQILTPRFSAKSAQDVIHACCVNFTITQQQLLQYIRHPTPILILNDVGIYLHLGGLQILKKTIALSQTALLNAYFGTTLLEDYGSYISRREEVMLGLLSRSLDTYLCPHYPTNEGVRLNGTKS